ncbi:MAG: TOBE domain-containing protein [Amaricoccus sp.]
MLASDRVEVGGLPLNCLPNGHAAGARLTVAIRPEDIQVPPAGAATPNLIEAAVGPVEFLGSHVRTRLAHPAFGDAPLTAELSQNLARRVHLSEGERLPVLLPPDRVLRAGTERSFANYASYFRTPALTRSIINSVIVSLLTTLFTVTLAFGFAYALQRTAMPLKGLFRTIAMVPIVFVGAYLVEKGRGFLAARTGLQFLAMMPMAVPGLVLGLSYIFFFNAPWNPLGTIYGTMTILVVYTITHFYTVSHPTALTALKAMDKEFEAVSASLKQPMTRMFTRVTVPVCLPTGLDIAAYLFVNALTTVSAVVFLYSPRTTLAAVAALNMDDAGQIQAAAAMCMLIFYTNLGARCVHLLLSRGLANTQAWRTR